ncbi:MAG: TIGR00730 family Rossman fold protein [Candidatus Hydrogenedentes bacterium]|nr:TIGR00730 family Rossman fold protein [Candidatus Hydrogenedentota bacterium]
MRVALRGALEWRRAPRSFEGLANVAIHSVCVFCASSNEVPRIYVDAAAHLGHCLAARGITLVYGGGNNGLMGVLAQAVHKSGGHVIGVIPLALQELELAYVDADELIVTRDLRERKATMEARSDAYIALPGGYGTLEEILETVTLRQLRFHEKPVAFLNTAGFYEPLVEFFMHMIEQGFAKATSTSLFHLAPTPEEALDYLGSYEPQPGKYVP